MDEYIKRKDAFEILQSRLDSTSQMSYLNMDWHELDIMRNAIENAIDDIGEVPSADVQPVDRWIDAQKNPPPIIDRRSMTSKSVLILRDNGRCSVAYYCNSAEDGDYWTTDDDKTMYCWEEVTHWQPLPKPPKDGDEE